MSIPENNKSEAVKTEIVTSESAVMQITHQPESIHVTGIMKIVIPTREDLMYILSQGLAHIEKNGRGETLLEMMRTVSEKLEAFVSGETTNRKYISTKELSRLYNISESQQKNLRGRLHNPLPYYQEEKGSKIRYSIEEVDQWIQDNGGHS